MIKLYVRDFSANSQHASSQKNGAIFKAPHALLDKWRAFLVDKHFVILGHLGQIVLEKIVCVWTACAPYCVQAKCVALSRKKQGSIKNYQHFLVTILEPEQAADSRPPVEK